MRAWKITACVWFAMAGAAAGCQRSRPPDATPPAAENTTGTIHVERLDETEAVLARLNQKAWVFKHWGGDVTSELTIYHRPEGADQQERVIYTDSGDDAIRARWELRQEPDDTPHDDAGLGTGRHPPEADAEAGYLIVVVPALPNRLTPGELITFSFHLPGGAGVVSTRAAETVYPKTVLSHSRMSSGSGAVQQPVALTPGETKVLVDYTERFGSSRSEPPARDRETLRYVINITALKDGWLPKRASRAESGSNRFP